ncbi:MAG: archaetidylinositol phosphate synthase [Methanosarcinaceae archaeon]|nr:CDP-alcohol phosphatidyltransferase family protein [Methanosarcinaceae archaeon]MDF1533504.1 archaetidylinositol phosphate synthase [Methanosarcinaceae archaeon]
MTFNYLRPFASKFIEPVAKAFTKAGISPNTVSIISLLFAAMAGVYFYYADGNPKIVLIAGLFVFFNSFLDAMDGLMARHLKIAGAKGDFLDHVIDRYSDVFIICGIFLGGHIDWRIGVVAIVGVLLTSYLGTQAQALNIGRYYGGVMGRADRLILIILASIIYFVYPICVSGFSALGWVMIAIAVGSHITALQRIIHIWKSL